MIAFSAHFKNSSPRFVKTATLRPPAQTRSTRSPPYSRCTNQRRRADESPSANCPCEPLLRSNLLFDKVEYSAIDCFWRMTRTTRQRSLVMTVITTHAEKKVIGVHDDAESLVCTTCYAQRTTQEQPHGQFTLACLDYRQRICFGNARSRAA